MKLPYSRIRSALPCALVASLLAATACGHDDKDVVFSSGVDTTKRGATLDDNDKQQFCSSLDNHVQLVIGFQEIAQIGCLPIALLATSRAACEQTLNDCVDKAPNPITVDVQQTHDQTCYDSLAMCDQSVGMLESCVNINIAAVRAVLSTLTCARFNDNSAIEQANHVMDTASTCANASASCNAATTLLL